MRTASERIVQAQSRYKADFDSHVRVRNQDLKPGDHVFVRRETPVEGERNKLLSPSMGPYKVVKKSSHTVVILDEDGLEDTVSLDRVVRAPNTSARIEVPDEEEPSVDGNAEQEGAGEPDSQTQSEGADPNESTPVQDTTSPNRVDDGRMLTRAKARAQRELTQAQQTQVDARSTVLPEEPPVRELLTDDESYDHGFDRILKYNISGNQFRVRWTGYSSKDDTWVNPEDLPPNAIVRFFRRRRQEIPDAVRARLPHYLHEINIVDDVWT